MTQLQESSLKPLTRRLIGWEVIVVFGVSLGASALFAIINLIGSLTASKALGKQQALLVGSLAPGRPPGPGPAAGQHPHHARPGGAGVLPAGPGRRYAVLGDGPGRPASRAGTWPRGAVLAALIGGSGLALYLTAYKLGVGADVVPETCPSVWWRIPVLILDATQNGILEEILVIGYLLRRSTSWAGPRPRRSRSARWYAARTTSTRASAGSSGTP